VKRSCSPKIDRRETIRLAGGWVLFLGTASLVESCGPQNGARGQQQPTCGCDATPSGTDSGLMRSDLPDNSVAYNASAQLFVCHDAQGFYCMDSLCPHQGCDIGQQNGGFSPSDLAAGFFCGCHGSSFDANGHLTGGPAPNGLAHYQVAFDGAGAIWIDFNKRVSADCRCL
jgi:Rieske Fe-S protein